MVPNSVDVSFSSLGPSKEVPGCRALEARSLEVAQAPSEPIADLSSGVATDMLDASWLC